ncbi:MULTISPECIES: phosphotransferase family protein [unclassified Rhodococcus (in: high G+C Gram-positive bacteria)]|uniref:phosphotransferase family protein n=1 Tax=unclassified Rhodococcus (in: high G+C Gram-positive bacteria) TaxID=192944 RepID=UPI001639AE21|nr:MULTISPECIES: phosphotransferase family protein [unclassified Rhodococcus (in: high G+C Gram-positive bacteria)]MBC2638936.1 phosphotransferase family protein [Rhodococcus sp. 3A]MBC2896323.1 phosphotransferase family protein [Rhodococcus sp. 4CII]
MSSVDVVGIDTGAVSRWFGTLGIECAEPLTFDRIGLGQSNLTYLVQDRAGRRWVLRRPPLGHLLASAHDVAREARILSALEDTPVPTPRVFGLTDDPDVTDVPLLLMEFVDGQVVDRMSIAEGLTPQRRRAIGLSLPRTLAKIHAVDLDRTGLTDLASHKPYAQRQLKRWSGQWEKSKTRELPALDDLTRRLGAAVPEQRELTLVHGDFHLRNVITSFDSGAVTAALDWELCTLGDPLADVGSLLAYWPEPGETTGGDFPASTLDGFPDRVEIAAVYLEETGRDPDALAFWHVLGLWKVAVIAEGVMRRARDEPQNKAPAGTPTVERIDALVAKACDVAARAGI